MVADFRSEQVADIILECMADFIGIRKYCGAPERATTARAQSSRPQQTPSALPPSWHRDLILARNCLGHPIIAVGA